MCASECWPAVQVLVGRRHICAGLYVHAPDSRAHTHSRPVFFGLLQFARSSLYCVLPVTHNRTTTTCSPVRFFVAERTNGINAQQYQQQQQRRRCAHFVRDASSRSSSLARSPAGCSRSAPSVHLNVWFNYHQRRVCVAARMQLIVDNSSGII